MMSVRTTPAVLSHPPVILSLVSVKLHAQGKFLSRSLCRLEDRDPSLTLSENLQAIRSELLPRNVDQDIGRHTESRIEILRCTNNDDNEHFGEFSKQHQEGL